MNLKLLTAAATVAALAAGAASAYTVSITGGEYYLAEYDTISLTATNSTLQNSYFFNSGNGQTDGHAAAGLIQLETNVPNAGGGTTVLQSYCVDLLDNINLANGVSGSYSTQGYPINAGASSAASGYSSGVSLTTTQLNDVAFLAQFGEWLAHNDNYANSATTDLGGLGREDYAIWFGDGSGSAFDLGLSNNSYYEYSTNAVNGAGGDIQAAQAAVQAAIWDTIYNGAGTTALSISFSGANNTYGCATDAACIAGGGTGANGISEEQDYFNQLKALLSGLSLTGTGANLPQLQSAGVQDVQLVYASGALPEPGAWALMIGGVFGVGAVLRRKRREIAAAA